MTSATPRAPNPRVQNPRGHGDRLRLELLDAAADLMAEAGEAVSLRAVAARAGVSPTAVYRHFDDHGDLLRAAVSYCWAEFESRLDAAASAHADPYAAFRAAGDAYVGFASEQPGKYQVIFSDRIDVGSGEDSPGIGAFEKLVALVAAILDDKGDERDPTFVAVLVHTWIHGIVDLTCRHPHSMWPPLDVLLDELALRLGLARS